MNLTRCIAEYAISYRTKPLDTEIRKLAKQHLLDTFACILCGTKEETADLILKYLKRYQTEGGISIWGSDTLRIRSEKAAFYYGVCAHDCDYDNLSKNLNGHPGAGILPVVMALCGECNTDGETVLRAFIAGTEVDAAIGRGFLQSDLHPGWMQTSVLGIFGAVAAGGVLLGIDAETLEHAFGMAAGEASGVKINFGSAAKDITVGHMCEKAVFCLKMAQLGLKSSQDTLGSNRGFFKTLCKTCQMDEIVDWMKSGNSDFTTPGIILKPYPSCRGVHNGIDGMLSIIERHSFHSSEVQTVECLVQDTVLTADRYPIPQTPEQGKFSLAYCLALCACKHKVAVDNFSKTAVIEPEISTFMKKVTVTEDNSFHNAKNGIELRVTLHNGETYFYRGAYAKGDPNHPLDDKEHEGKLYDCFLRVTKKSEADEYIRIFRNLEVVKNVKDLWVK